MKSLSFTFITFALLLTGGCQPRRTVNMTRRTPPRTEAERISTGATAQRAAGGTALVTPPISSVPTFVLASNTPTTDFPEVVVKKHAHRPTLWLVDDPTAPMVHLRLVLNLPKPASPHEQMVRDASALTSFYQLRQPTQRTTNRSCPTPAKAVFSGRSLIIHLQINASTARNTIDECVQRLLSAEPRRSEFQLAVAALKKQRPTTFSVSSIAEWLTADAWSTATPSSNTGHNRKRGVKRWEVTTYRHHAYVATNLTLVLVGPRTAIDNVDTGLRARPAHRTAPSRSAISNKEQSAPSAAVSPLVVPAHVRQTHAFVAYAQLLADAPSTVTAHLLLSTNFSATSVGALARPPVGLASVPRQMEQPHAPPARRMSAERFVLRLAPQLFRQTSPRRLSTIQARLRTHWLSRVSSPDGFATFLAVCASEHLAPSYPQQVLDALTRPPSKLPWHNVTRALSHPSHYGFVVPLNSASNHQSLPLLRPSLPTPSLPSR